MQTWFTSDLHLGHAKIIELAGRPFVSLDEMHDTIIQRWNERVTRDDVVWILGDVALGSIRESLALIRKLNGSKHLVMGNHDRCFPEYRPKGPRPQDFELYTDVGLKVHDELVVDVLHVSKQRGVEIWQLSHFPYDGDSDPREERYAHLRPKIRHEAPVLLHGHIHRSVKLRDPRQIHVGMDAWDFRPVAEVEIVELLTSR